MSRRGWILFVSMGILWGIPYMFIKVAVRDFPAADVVFGRTVIGALLLLPFAAHRRALRPALAALHWVLLFGLMEMAVPWLLIVDAERRLPSALVGMLISLVPLFSAAFTWMFLDRNIMHRGRLLGMLIGVVGVGLLLGLDALTAPMDPWSVLEVVGVALLYATAPILVDRKLSHVPSLGVISLSVSAVAIAYAPFALLGPRPTPTVSSVVSLVMLGVFCTAVAFMIFFPLIAEIGPVRASVITFVNPAVAVVLGVAVLGESLTWGTVVGFPLVLAGSWLATRAPSQPAGPVAAQLAGAQEPAEPA